jgi:hypothetical protein
MSIQADIYTALSALASGRVYPQAAPAECEMPFIVWRRVSSDPTVTIHGQLLTTRSIFVFECWSDTYLAAINLADQVRDAIAASALESFLEQNPGDEYEPQIDAFMEPVTIGFWH